jgi:cardiolipin synthase
MDDTQVTHNFLQILKDKAKAGLEVVIIADAYGSASLKGGAAEELHAAGAEIIFFSHWFRHTHRKILIIDGQTAFIGGVNISEKTRNWRDMQIRVAGTIVRPILHSFAYAYKMAGGKNEKVLHHSHRPLTQKIKSWLADNLVGTRTGAIHQLSTYYREKVAGAKESIVMVTPYLLPPRWMIALLDKACRRGVRVEILIPNDTDVKPLNKVNYLNACRLSGLGVQFYLLPVMNHAKIMLIDDAEGIIGSQNMDVLFFNWNIEAGVFFQQ